MVYLQNKKPAIVILLLRFSVPWTIFNFGLDAGLEGKPSGCALGFAFGNPLASDSPRVKFFQTTPATF